MNKIQFKNPDGIYSVTVDGIQYKVQIEHTTVFSIQDESRHQLGKLEIDGATGSEYIQVVNTQGKGQSVIAEQHVNTWEHGIYDSDCIRWAITQLTSD